MKKLREESNPMSVYEFGDSLLKENDLDPVYTILWNVGFSQDRMKHYLIAYWCFYHLGTAAWITETREGFWNRMREAAGSKDYPRKPERRHFRGDNAKKSVEYLESQGVDGLWSPLLKQKRMSLTEVMAIVQKWVGFGPWIAFKVADMLERLNLVKVSFDNSSMFLFDSPNQGAKLLYEETPGRVERGWDKKRINAWAVETLVKYFSSGSNPLAPPRFERVINSQEVETILCKWKSYRNGHYVIGEDVVGCRESLELSPQYSDLSNRLLDAGKKGGLW